MSEVGFRVYEPNGVVAVGTNTQGVWPIAVLTITDEYFARIKFGDVQYTYDSFGRTYTYDPPRVATTFESKLLRRTCTLNGTDDTFAQSVIETAVSTTFEMYNTTVPLISFNSQAVPEVKVALPTPVKFSDIYIIPIPTEVDVASLPEVTADVLSTELSIKNSPQATAVPTYPTDPRPVISMYGQVTSNGSVGCVPQATGSNSYLGDPCHDKWLVSTNLAKANTVVWEQVVASHSAKFYVLGKGR